MIDAETLKLPGFNASTVWYLVYFLFVVILLLFLAQLRIRAKHRRQAFDNRFMQIMMRRGLSKFQLNIANNFFSSLREAQKDEIFLSPKSLQTYLHQYLDSHPTLPAHDRTEIFDKLLPHNTSQIEIKSVSDLRVGEVVAIDVETKSYLATVLKIKDEMVLVSSSEKRDLEIGAKVKLYAYRPLLGSFLLEGEITKSTGQSVVFKHSGVIEFRGDQHLMSEVVLPFQLEAWPHPKADLEISENTKAVEIFAGSTEKISDRGFVVTFATKPSDAMLRRQEYWEITLALPDEPLVCRVRIVPHQKASRWLMRPADLDETGRALLFKFISANTPVREHL